MSESPDTIKIMIQGKRVALRPKDIDNNDNQKLKYEELPLMKVRLGEEVLDLCRRLIQEDQIKTEGDFKLIGKLLYHALFTEKGSDGFQNARSLVKPTSQKRLRVELEFQKDDRLGLSKLPWEYLCYPNNSGGWDFVSTVAELVLTRCLEPKTSAPRTVKFDPGKINVLLVILNPEPDPEGLGDLAIVEKGVKEALDKFKKCYSSHNIQVNISEKKPATWENFGKLITEPDCQPHILHLIAHGQFVEGQRGRSGQIAFHLTDQPVEVPIEGGNSDWKDDRSIASLFDSAKEVPRFVFLHTCESGVTDNKDTPAGVALYLAQSGVPAVVAMQHKIDKIAATVFSTTFYEELGNGSTLDEAVQQGRAKIAEAYSNKRAFGTPILFLLNRNDYDPILPTVKKAIKPPPTELYDVIFYDEHLRKIIRKYREEEILPEAMIRPVEADLLDMDGKKFEELKSKLRAGYKQNSDGDENQGKLMSLFIALLKEIGDHGK